MNRTLQYVGESKTSDNISSMLKQLSRGQKRLLSYFRHEAYERSLWDALRSKQSAITIALDAGGLKGTQGTFGWQVRSKSNKVIAEGAGPVDGPFDVANSTRCKLGGYASAFLFLSLLYKMWGSGHKCCL
jgi:hypothetical protein